MAHRKNSENDLKLLAIGSCRVLVTLNRFEIYTDNTWEQIGRRDLNPKSLIGRSWSINEHLELLKLIRGDKLHKSYKGSELSLVAIRPCLNHLKKIYESITALVVEISSLRYYTLPDGTIIHNVIHSQLKSSCRHEKLTLEEHKRYLEEFIQYSEKPIFFVSHFDMKSRGYRQEIWQSIKDASKKYPNVFYIDASVQPNLSIMDDNEHYTPQGFSNARKYIGDIILKNIEELSYNNKLFHLLSKKIKT